MAKFTLYYTEKLVLINSSVIFLLECKIEHCQKCFTKGYCTNCKPGFFLHDGKCLEKCPPNLYANELESECQEESKKIFPSIKYHLLILFFD